MEDEEGLTGSGEIRKGTRRLGYIQLLSLVTGNVFAAAFAFALINKRKTPEYTFAVYMFLTQLFVIAISAVNIFKPYVTDTFPAAMVFLLGHCGFPFSCVDHRCEVGEGRRSSAVDWDYCGHRHSYCSDGQSFRAAAWMEPVVEINEQ